MDRLLCLDDNNKNNISETITEWNNVAKWYHEKSIMFAHWHQIHDINPIMLQLLEDVKGKKILDIACGNGYFSRILANRGGKVCGIDISDKMISLAQNIEKESRLGIDYFIQDCSCVELFNDKSFHYVVANMCLMDVLNAKDTIREAFRVLKDNGFFIFSITHPFTVNQTWSTIINNGKPYFSRNISNYLTEKKEARKVSWIDDKLLVTQYHRPIQKYLSWLIEVGFKIENFHEIPESKEVKKNKALNVMISQNRSLYNTIIEKEMKERAGREIPFFLIIGANKP